MKSRYQIDTEALRVYFPYKNVLDGMFHIYEHDFGLKFTPVEAPYKWVPDLQLFVASDAASGEPLGLFYLDMFPRKGKYGHFAEFGIIDGKALPDGKYQRPVVCLVCNFPPPADGKPSLLTHDDVTTVFHEFGHALHAMLTRARFGRYAGTNVPGDFVEAPSQMLENWPLDKTVLDQFAADYRDASKKIPQATLDQLKAAQLATAGTYYHRQFALAKFDLVLHGPHPLNEPYDCVQVSNDILAKVYLPIDPHTAMIASFGHLADGYDAGYYGYAWARAIAADMATVFRRAPGGFMDADVGRRLRREIYEPGNSRDVGESVEKFLGRPRSTAPFLENDLGLAPADPKDAAAPPVPSTVK
jgi:thimet oligopeptidase